MTLVDGKKPTTCEICGDRIATHMVRDTADERHAVCCDCMYDRSYGYMERCTEEDDCWPVDKTRAYSKGLLRCDDCGVRCTELAGRCPNGAGGVHTLVEYTP
jgi:hypothetical protein